METLNKAIREIRLGQGKISTKSYQCQTARETKTFLHENRICFTETDKKLGIPKGAFGSIQEISEVKCTVQMDKEEVISFDLTFYHGIKLGYASTVYKAQGKTLDQIYVLHDKTTNKRLSYVALTRQPATLKIFVNKEKTEGLTDLVKQLGRKDSRVPSLNYTTQGDLKHLQQKQGRTYLEVPKGLLQDIKYFAKTSL